MSAEGEREPQVGALCLSREREHLCHVLPQNIPASPKDSWLLKLSLGGSLSRIVSSSKVVPPSPHYLLSNGVWILSIPGY